MSGTRGHVTAEVMEQGSAPGPSGPTPPAGNGSEDAIEQETRFAVVLYGGVSLAIYITGVCRELLNMVRATAGTDATVPETELAYRLAGMLGVPGSDGAEKIADLLDAYAANTSDDGTRVAELEAAAAELGPVRRRFVVDVLSGSSAGGLNAIYLAKALTHGQSIDHLQDFWIHQGGFGEVLNDRHAAARHDAITSDHGTVETEEPASLFSGDLMYLKLLDALEVMDRDDPPGGSLVDALDCYLTTTDLRGLLLPVRLSDERSVPETRHRSVFHLAFGTPAASGGHIDHFAAERNQHLAFIARATSAFPGAFEPVQAQSIATGLSTWIVRPTERPKLAFDQFLPDRLSPRLRFGEVPWTEEMPLRWYSDGGAMDNKPFSYVLDPLRNRRAVVPVTRQLLYVEPDPADQRLSPLDRTRPPTFQEATLDAFNLGRKETIREDIERVLDRNTVLRRLKRGFDDQIGVQAQQAATGPQPDSGRDAARRRRDAWLEATYGELVAAAGTPDHDVDLCYEFHKTVWVGGELGELMARVAGFAPDSAQARWVVDMTQRYSKTRYVPERLDDRGGSATLHRPFLLAVDLGYRLRRLMFVDKVLRRLQEARLTGELESLLDKWRLSPNDVVPDELRSLRAALNEVDVDLRCIGRRLRSGRPELAFEDRLAVWEQDPEWRARWGDDVRTPERDESMLFAQRATRLAGWLDDFERWKGQVELMARERTSAPREPRSGDTLPDADDIARLDALVAEIGSVLEPWLRAASTKALTTIDEHLTGRDSLHRLVRAVYDRYEVFDKFVLPSWGLARGELAEANITRVSPLDATALISVSAIHGHETNKLAGNSLGHFGGFLDAWWRRNDLLWGRLDGAEILLHRVLPHPEDADVRDRLIALAHDRILAEEWDTVLLLPKIAEEVPLPESRAPTDVTLERADEHLASAARNPSVAKAFISNDFSVSLDPRGRVEPELVGRALGVLGRMSVYHGVTVPHRQGASSFGGQVLAAVSRTLRLGFPSGANRSSQIFLVLQRVAFALALAIGIGLIGYSVVADAVAGLIALGAGIVPLAILAVVFRTAAIGRSAFWNTVKSLLLVVPFGLFALALALDATAALAAAAGFALVLLVTLAVGPSLFAQLQFRRLTRRPRRRTAVQRGPNRTRVIGTSARRSDVARVLTTTPELLRGWSILAPSWRRDHTARRDLREGDRLRVEIPAPDSVGAGGPEVPSHHSSRSTSSDEHSPPSARVTVLAIEVVEVVPGRRLVVRWGVIGDEVIPPGRAVMSIRFRDRNPFTTDRQGTVVEMRSTFDPVGAGVVPMRLQQLWGDQIGRVVESAPAALGSEAFGCPGQAAPTLSRN